MILMTNYAGTWPADKLVAWPRVYRVLEDTTSRLYIFDYLSPHTGLYFLELDNGIL